MCCCLQEVANNRVRLTSVASCVTQTRLQRLTSKKYDTGVSGFVHNEKNLLEGHELRHTIGIDKHQVWTIIETNRVANGTNPSLSTN